MYGFMDLSQKHVFAFGFITLNGISIHYLFLKMHEQIFFSSLGFTSSRVFMYLF